MALERSRIFSCWDGDIMKQKTKLGKATVYTDGFFRGYIVRPPPCNARLSLVRCDQVMYESIFKFYIDILIYIFTTIVTYFKQENIPLLYIESNLK